MNVASPPPKSSGQEPNDGQGAQFGVGIPVDARGGPTVDPTKNVLDLVRAESKYQDSMRDAMEKHVDTRLDSLKEKLHLIANSNDRYQDAQRLAETRRLDELANTRQEFQNTIRDMLAESVRTTSTLVSTQLVQIQATFDTRVSKLEAGAFTQAGKSSVADPQITDAITRIGLGLSNLKTNTDESIARMAAANIEAMSKVTAAINTIGASGTKTDTLRMGQGQVIGWIVGAAMLIAAIASPLIAVFALRPH